MTRQEFLSIFEKKLDVAEPMRSDIIAEITSHLEESTDAGDCDLGDPLKLANELNRVHIGFFADRKRMFLAPIFAGILLFVVSVLFPASGLTDMSYLSAWQGIAFYVGRFFAVIIPLTLAVLIGRTFAKKRATKLDFLWTLVETVLIIAMYQVLQSIVLGFAFQEAIGFFEYIVFSAIGTSVALGIFAFAGLVFSKPVDPRKKGVIGVRVTFELVCFLILMVFILIAGGLVAEMFFAPYDVAILRPPEGTVIRDVNDFFESAVGTNILILSSEIICFALFLRRLWVVHRVHFHSILAWVLAFGASAAVAILDLRLPSFAITAILLAVLGLLFGVFKPRGFWSWAVILASGVPIVQLVVSILMPFHLQYYERGSLFLVSFVSILPTIAGLLIGRSIREMKNGRQKELATKE